ncbi:hypothetical protein ABID96_001093 [Bacillus sp. OAE603]
MKEVIGLIFVFITGIIFLGVGLFYFEKFYIHYKEFNENRIDLFPFINDYWFTRILFICIGVFLIFIILYSLFN